MYEAEFYEELLQGTAIEKEIELIVLELLRDFSFLKENEEYHDGDDSDEECGREESTTQNILQSTTQNIHNLRSNYFQKQLRLMATKYGVPKGGADDNEGDDMSDVTAKVFCHLTLTEISKTMDEHRLCRKRDLME